MPKMQFTQKGVEALLRKPHDRRTDYNDTVTKGLSLRVGPRGASWYFLRRIDGKLVRVKLGDWPGTGIAAARDRFGDIQDQVGEGKHPKAVKAREQAEKTESRKIDKARLFENAAEGWAEKHLPEVADQTRKMYRRAVRRLTEEFKGRDIATITRGELVRFLDRLKAASKSGIPANHAAATIRLLFAYAADRLDLKSNPAAGLKNPARVKQRKRILNRAEIRILWRACELAGYPYGHALRLALCTGQRIGEIGDMRRDDLEGDYWELSRNKTSKRIDVYLADHARAILDDCPSFGDGAPFFSASGGKIGLRPDGFHNAVNRHIRPRLDDAAVDLGLRDEDSEKPAIADHWTPHDLRRTVRSGLTGWAGVFPDIAERTINHAISGIRSVYDHADYRPHVTSALKQWDRELCLILAGLPSAHELRDKGRTDKQIDALIKKARKGEGRNVTPIKRATA